jgi:hypothetical protein
MSGPQPLRPPPQSFDSRHPRRRSSFLACLVASLFFGSLAACSRDLVAGDYACGDGGTPMPNLDEAIEVPWTTGFERGFCDYLHFSGFCYQPDTFQIVSSPVHSGKHAGAFHIVSDDPSKQQARCVRQGIFPKEVYFSAWYYIPVRASSTGNWNLFHYRGGVSTPTDGLWDVSLADAANGDLNLFLRKGPRTLGIGETPPVPIEAWFQIEVYFRRAADATGELTVFQDGQQIVSLTGESTDMFEWGQWYVGNLADGLTPNESTVYVDDVSIRETR